MHISLDSALGKQRRLNQVGETISSIAAPTAAYSLRSLTGGDPKAVRVRRVNEDEQDFTASEVSSGALVDFVLGNTKSLLNSRAYFDGSNDNVGLTSEINLTGDFSLEYTFVVTEASQQIIGKNAGGSYLRAEGSTEITGFRIQTDGSASTVSLTSNLKYGEANTVKLKRVSGKFGIYNESDVLISAEFTNSDTFTISSFGKARGTFAKGVIYNIRIDTNNDGTIDNSYNGYGNSVSDWTDLVGSNNAAAVNGSPALFTGQDQDGFVETWYDQSGNGNDATQATSGSQPTIVENGSLNLQNTKPSIKFDGTDDNMDTSHVVGATSNIFGVCQSNNASDILLDMRDGGTDGAFILSETSNSFKIRYNSTDLSGTSGASGLKLGSFLLKDGNQEIRINGSSVGSATTSGTISVTATTQIGGRSFSTAASSVWDGSMSEIIIYNSDQSANRPAIETNINNHYSIF